MKDEKRMRFVSAEQVARLAGVSPFGGVANLHAGRQRCAGNP